MTEAQWDTLVARNPEYAQFHPNKSKASSTGVSPAKTSLECIHLGKPVRGETAPDTLRDWRRCDAGHGIICHSCNCNAVKCNDYIADTAEGLDPNEKARLDSMKWPIRFDTKNMAPEVIDRRFNSSIAEWNGGYVFVFRDRWAGSNIWMHKLDANFKPVGKAWKLALKHRECANGREDPRLFWHAGKLHVMFTGVVMSPIHTNVLYARLSDTLEVEAVYAPKYEGRNHWEKNWGFFSHENQLFAVYTIAPHKVLRINGDEVEEVITTPNFSYWTGGEMRGGASPIRVGDEFWSFFHASKNIQGKVVYHTGLYTFEAKYPFRVKRIINDPIQWPDQAVCPKNQEIKVIFAGGAIQREDSFIVAHGIFDTWSELNRFKRADLESKLVPATPPDDFAFREGCNDSAIWQSIAGGHDEYKLARLNLRGATVIDIGAHIGIAAKEFLRRGASVVHCYEPDPRNVELLRNNLAGHRGARVFDRPVWSHAEKLRLTSREEPSHNSVEVDLAGDIDAIPIEEAIQRAIAERGPGLMVMKLDCEDSEGAIVPAASELLHLFDVVVGEWHTFFSYEACRTTLISAGFSFETCDPKLGGGLFFAQKPRIPNA